MRTVSAREANQPFSRLLEGAVEGEEVTITRRGVPAAKLVPIVDAREADANRRAAIAWLGSGPLPGQAPSWTRAELYERDNG